MTMPDPTPAGPMSEEIDSLLSRYEAAYEQQKGNGPDAALMVMAHYGELALIALRRLRSRPGTVEVAWQDPSTAPEYEFVEVKCNDPLVGEYLATAKLTDAGSDPARMVWIDPGSDVFCEQGESYIVGWRPRSLSHQPGTGGR